MSDSTMTRRALVAGAAAALPAVAVDAAAQAGRSESDPTEAELFALEDQIHRAFDEADRLNRFLSELTVQQQRADPISDALSARVDAAFEIAGALVERMWSIKATTEEGRAAKVRVLLGHITDESEWEGPDEDLDHDKSLVRRLLIEFSGRSSVEELVLNVASEAVQS